MEKYILSLLFVIAFNTSSALAAVQMEFSNGISGISDSTVSKSVAYFEYSPETQYEINTQLGYVTDLQLRCGDSITNTVAGDTERWMVDTVVVDGIPHVYVKPIQENISTNIIINTTQKTYRLLVHSTDNYIPVVVWTYPEDSILVKSEGEKKKTNGVDAALVALYYNYNYTVKAKKQIWIPKTIYDDGTRTFISIPSDTKNDLPVINVLDDKFSALVNYRVKDGWFIVDRVFKTAVLNFTAEKSIIIRNMKGEEK